MVTYLFRNSGYRTYFELMDAFPADGCPLCVLLSGSERDLISKFVTRRRRKKTSSRHRRLCAVHKLRLKNIVADHAAFLKILKNALRGSLSALAHPGKSPKFQWRRWFEPFVWGCPVCKELSLRESTLCRALTRFLGDTEFWKSFSRAPLLCSDHLEKT